jgi:general secretion pathway protein C
MKRGPFVASFVLFIVLCVSVAYWAMQLFKPPTRAVAAPPQATQPAPKIDAAANLFGGRSTIAVASNFQLKGVVVSGTSAGSVAILSADGKPAQAVGVNAEVMPGVIVKEVHPRYVLLSEGGVAKRVELPEDPKAQAGVDLPVAPQTQTGSQKGAAIVSTPPNPMPSPEPGTPGQATPPAGPSGAAPSPGAISTSPQDAAPQMPSQQR